MAIRVPIRGTAALITAALIVAITVIWLPAYRVFLAISIGMGIVVAAVLYFWHKFRPVRGEDVNHKRPLGLQ